MAHCVETGMLPHICYICAFDWHFQFSYAAYKYSTFCTGTHCNLMRHCSSASLVLEYGVEHDVFSPYTAGGKWLQPPQLDYMLVFL